MTTQADKAQQFVELHQSGTFIMANFWDVGSAVILEKMGFKALASTSAGAAQALGKLDSQLTLDEKLTHLAQVCAVTSAPVSADFEHGFADEPQKAAENLIRAAQAGIVGASIEDWSREATYDIGLAVERIQACAEAKNKLAFPFTLTARAENLLRQTGDLDEAIKRLQAYADAGADVLYAPGLANEEQITAVLQAVDKPINVLFAFMPDMPLSKYKSLGVRRISLGGALANLATGVVLDAATAMLEAGDFTWAKNMASGRTINQLLG